MCAPVFILSMPQTNALTLEGKLQKITPTDKIKQDMCSKNCVGSSMADCIKLYVRLLYFFFRIEKSAVRFGLILKTLGYKPNFELDSKPQGKI